MIKSGQDTAIFDPEGCGGVHGGIKQLCIGRPLGGQSKLKSHASFFQIYICGSM